MNPELEKLVDYALVDGYIADKERQVLFKKAAALGFDTDELEMILEGRLGEKRNSSRPQVEKCPSCGEILSGLSKVCPSCRYVLNSESKEDTETLDDATQRLEESIAALKLVPKPGSSKIFNAAILIIVTGGLYAIYIKLVKKEALFDRYAMINEKILAVTDNQVRSLRVKYGEDQKINDYINQLIAERDTLIQTRQRADSISALFILVIVTVVLGAFAFLISAAPKLETTEVMTQRYIKESRIKQAHATVVQMQEGPLKTKLSNIIWGKIADSLAREGRYYDAIEIVKHSIVYDTAWPDYHRAEKRDSIIEMQVDDLIAKKEFAKARELYPEQQFVLDKVNYADSVNKSEEEKIVKKEVYSVPTSKKRKKHKR